MENLWSPFREARGTVEDEVNSKVAVANNFQARAKAASQDTSLRSCNNDDNESEFSLSMIDSRTMSIVDKLPDDAFTLQSYNQQNDQGENMFYQNEEDEDSEPGYGPANIRSIGGRRRGFPPPLQVREKRTSSLILPDPQDTPLQKRDQQSHRRISVQTILPYDAKLVPAYPADENRRQPVGVRLSHSVRLDAVLIPENSVLLEVDGRNVKDLASAVVLDILKDLRGRKIELAWLRPKTVGTRKLRSKSTDGNTSRRKRRSSGLSSLKSIWQSLQDLAQAMDSKDELASLLQLPLTAQSEVVQPGGFDNGLDSRQDDAVKRARVEDISQLLENLACKLQRRMSEASRVASNLHDTKAENFRLVQQNEMQRELIQQLEGEPGLHGAASSKDPKMSRYPEHRRLVDEERKDGFLAEDDASVGSQKTNDTDRERLVQATSNLRTAVAAKQFFEHKVKVMEDALEASEKRLVEEHKALEKARQDFALQEKQLQKQQESITALKESHANDIALRLEEQKNIHYGQMQELASSLDSKYDEKFKSALAREESLRSQVVRLQENLAAKDQEIEHLSQIVQKNKINEQKRMSVQDKERASSSEELELWQRDARQLRATVEQLGLQLSKADKSLSAEKSKVESSHREIDRLEHLIKDSKDKLKEAHSEHENSRKENEALLQQLHDVESRAARSKTDSAQARMEMEELRHLQAAQIAELETKYRELKHAKDAAQEEEMKNETSAQDSVKKLQRQLETSQAHIQQQDETCEILREQIHALSEQLAKRDGELDQMRSKATGEASEKFQSVLARVEQDFETELTKVNKLVSQREADLSKLRTVLNSKEQELSDLKDSYRQALSHSSEDRDNLAAELLESRSELAAERTRISELTTRLNEALRAKNDSEASLNKAQKAVTEMQSISESLREARLEISNLHGIRDDLQNTKDKIATLEVERSEILIRTKAAETRAQTAEDAAENFRVKLDEAEGLRSGLQRAQSEQQTVAQRIQSDLNEQRKSCSALRRKVADLEQELESREGSLAAQRTKEAQLNDTAKRLTESLERVQAELQETKTILADKFSEAYSLENDITQLQSEKEQLQADVESATAGTAHVKRLKDQIEEAATRAAENAEAKLRARDEQIEILEKDLSEARQAFARAEKESLHASRRQDERATELQRMISRLQMQQNHCREQSLAILETFSSELESSLLSAKRRAEEQSMRYKRRLEMMQAALNHANNRVSSQQDTFETLTKDRHAELDNLRQKLSESADSEAGLRRELAMAKATLMSQKEELQVADKRVQSQQGVISQLRTRYAELEDAMEGTRADAKLNVVRLEAEVARMNEIIVGQTSETSADHTHKVEELEWKVGKLERENKVLEDSQTALKDRIAELNEAKEQTYKNTQALRHQLEEEQIRSNDAEVQVSKLGARLKSLQDAQEDSQNQVTANENRMKNQLNRLRDLLEEAQKSSSDAGSLRRELGELRSERDRLREVIKEERTKSSSLESQILSRASDSAREKEVLQEKSSQLVVDLQGAEKRISNLEKRLQSAEKEQAEAEASWESERSALESTIAELTNAKDNLIADTDERAYSLVQECDQLRRQVHALTEQEKELQLEKQSLIEHTEQLEKDLSRARTNLLKAQQDLETSVAGSDELAQAREQELVRLRAHCEDLEDKVELARVSKQKSQASWASLESKYRSDMQSLTKEKEKLAKYSQQIETKSSDELRRLRENHESDRQELLKRMEKLKDDLDERSRAHASQNEAQSKELADLRIRLAETKENLDRSEHSLTAMSNAHARELEQRTGELKLIHEQRINEVREVQITQLEELRHARQQDQALLKETKIGAANAADLSDKLEKDLEDFRAKNAVLSEELDELRNNFEALGADRTQLSETVEILRGRLHQLNAEISELNEGKTTLQERLVQVESLNSSLQSQSDEAQRLILEATERESNLRAQLEAQLLSSFENSQSTTSTANMATQTISPTMFSTSAQTNEDATCCGSAQSKNFSDAHIQTEQASCEKKIQTSTETEDLSSGHDQSCQTDDSTGTELQEELVRMRLLHREELACFLAKVQDEIMEERERLNLEQMVHLQRIDNEKNQLEEVVAEQAAELKRLRAHACDSDILPPPPPLRREQGQQTEQKTVPVEVNDAIVSEYDRLLLRDDPYPDGTLHELETTRAVLEASHAQVANLKAQEAETSFQTELLKSALETAHARIKELEEQRRSFDLEGTAARSQQSSVTQREEELYEEVISWRTVAERDAKRCAALLNAVTRESERATRLEERLLAERRRGRHLHNQHHHCQQLQLRDLGERDSEQLVQNLSSHSLDLSASGLTISDNFALREELETLASDMNDTLQALGNSGISQGLRDIGAMKRI